MLAFQKKKKSKYWDVKIRQHQIFNSLGRLVTNNRKYGTEISKCIGITKYAFQKISKLLRHKKLSLEAKKRMLDLL